MDVSTGTDSIKWTCRTERRTASNKRVGEGRAALGQCRRDGGTEETEETEETEKAEMRSIFRIEYKWLHEEKKKTNHGRQPSLYTQFSQLPYIPLLISAQLTYIVTLGLYRNRGVEVDEIRYRFFTAE